VAEAVAPEFIRFISDQRRAGRLAAPSRPRAEGEVSDTITVDAKAAAELMRVASRRAAGFFRPTKRTEVVWVEGENELAVGIAGVDVKLGVGLIRVLIPVRCDQTGPATVEALFVTGSPDAPAGLYAAAPRRPNGPPAIIDAWGDALVAFAWQCVLGLVTGIAAAVGKDTRGNLLVPAELAVSARGIEILPMARHRFAGSSSLKT
jgi:hypothetical protein